MKKPHIIILNDSAFPMAEKLARIVEGVVEGAAKRSVLTAHTFDDVGQRLRELFNAGNPIIAVMASGSIIRLLATELNDKNAEPPVIAVSSDGAQVVPLLGGHHGANALAKTIAKELGTNAAVTTAGDVQFGVALDTPPTGYVLANPENAKTVMAELAAGASANLNGEAAWLSKSGIPFDPQGKVTLTISETPIDAGPLQLVYHPLTHVLGMGCERGADFEELLKLAENTIAKAEIAPQTIAAICSLDVKADETAIHEVAAHFGVEARFFDAVQLEAQAARLKNPSEIVYDEVGCHGVAEGAALAAVGSEGSLVVEKNKSARATCAIGRAADVLDVSATGRSRGKLFVVGIGPGSDEWRSPQVSAMIGASSDLVGYSLYLDLVGKISQGKTRHDFDLGREEDRVRHAMELAGEGKNVSLVCSGDAGIYAMATLVFELLANGGLSDSAKRIAIEVSPGISALQAAASRIGAPLGHDFCTISLSDLLTPWEDIQKRVKAAAQGDFVIAFYNPVSKRRRTQLAFARDLLLEYRPFETPVVLATNLGREGENVKVVELGKLEIDDVDMLTVVIVGSSNTRTVDTQDGRVWVYTPRGYSAKIGTGINSEAAQ